MALRECEDIEYGLAEEDRGIVSASVSPPPPLNGVAIPGSDDGTLEHALLRDGEMMSEASTAASTAKPQVETMDVEAADEGAAGDGEGLAHRKHVPDTSLIKGAFHIFKGNVGVGIFLLPMIYNDCGYILSPLLAVPIGLMVVDCMLMLLDAKIRVRRETVQSYPQTVDFIFGSLGRLITICSIVLVQFSFCLIYVQTAAGIFRVFIHFNGAYKVFVLIATVVTLPLMFFSNNLSLLGFTSALASFLVWFTVFTTAYYAIKKLASEGIASDLTPTGSPADWPLFLASNLTVLEGIAVVLPVENATRPKDKPHVPLMVKGTMGSLIVLYLGYALLGNLAYGSELKESIVNVLPQSWIGDVVRSGLAINLLLTHPLQFVPAIEIIDAALGIPKDKIRSSKKAIAVRLMVSLVIMVLAMVVGSEAVGLVTSFVGATGAVVLAIILPPLMQLHLDHALADDGPRKGLDYYRPLWTTKLTLKRVKCFIYVFLGIAIFFIGTTVVIIDAGKLVTRKVHNPGPVRNTTATAAALLPFD